MWSDQRHGSAGTAHTMGCSSAASRLFHSMRGSGACHICGLLHLRSMLAQCPDRMRSWLHAAQFFSLAWMSSCSGWMRPARASASMSSRFIGFLSSVDQHCRVPGVFAGATAIPTRHTSECLRVPFRRTLGRLDGAVADAVQAAILFPHRAIAFDTAGALEGFAAFGAVPRAEACVLEPQLNS